MLTGHMLLITYGQRVAAACEGLALCHLSWEHPKSGSSAIRARGQGELRRFIPYTAIRAKTGFPFARFDHYEITSILHTIQNAQLRKHIAQ